MLPQLKIDAHTAVSVFSLGTVKLGRNTQVKYPYPFDLPSDEQIKSLLEFSKDIGINCLDTAPAYGNSEQRIGQLLQKRVDWLISTKVGENYLNGQSLFDLSKNAIQISIENSLKNLNTDYLDIVFVHSNGEDLKILNQTDTLNTLLLLQKQGKIRYLGISTKTFEGAMQSLEHFELLMLEQNIKLSDQILQENKLVFEKAQRLNKSIFIKKAFASGFLFTEKLQTQIDNLKLIFSTSATKSIVLGSLNTQNIQKNIELLKKGVFTFD